MFLKQLRIFWLYPVRLSRDAALGVLELHHEGKGEGLPQHPEFAHGQLRQTFGRSVWSALRAARRRASPTRLGTWATGTIMPAGAILIMLHTW